MASSDFYPYAVVTPAGNQTPTAHPLPPPREVPFRFTGDSKEYFRIWIVNVALTILTLGIYSAWAKVRTKQYFYRNTWLEDASFEYLADPRRILRGRIVMATLFALVFGAQYYSLPLYIGLVVVLALFTPLVIVSALAFNARNSAYRHVRFSFLGKTGEAFGIYLQMALLYLASCGLAYPHVQWRLTKFVLERHLYGDERFSWRTTSSSYFRVFLLTLLISIPVYVAFGAAFALIVYAAKSSGAEDPSTAILAPIVLAYGLLIIPAAYLRANIANELYNGLSVGPHAFASNQRSRDLMKLYITNALGVIASLGLLVPWAMIRLARYRAEHLKVYAVGALQADNFDLAGTPGALGDAATDLGDFGFDIGA